MAGTGDEEGDLGQGQASGPEPGDWLGGEGGEGGEGFGMRVVGGHGGFPIAYFLLPIAECQMPNAECRMFDVPKGHGMCSFARIFSVSPRRKGMGRRGSSIYVSGR